MRPLWVTTFADPRCRNDSFDGRNAPAPTIVAEARNSRRDTCEMWCGTLCSFLSP